MRRGGCFVCWAVQKKIATTLFFPRLSYLLCRLKNALFLLLLLFVWEVRVEETGFPC